MSLCGSEVFRILNLAPAIIITIIITKGQPTSVKAIDLGLHCPVPFAPKLRKISVHHMRR